MNTEEIEKAGQEISDIIIANLKNDFDIKAGNIVEKADKILTVINNNINIDNINQTIQNNTIILTLQTKVNELEKKINGLGKSPLNKIYNFFYKFCNCLCNLFHNHWFLIAIMLIIILGIILFAFIPSINIKDNYVGAILGIVGVLATFIVVGNYAQVKEVKEEFAGRIEEVNVTINNEKLNLRNEYKRIEAAIWLSNAHIHIANKKYSEAFFYSMSSLDEQLNGVSIFEIDNIKCSIELAYNIYSENGNKIKTSPEIAQSWAKNLKSVLISNQYDKNQNIGELITFLEKFTVCS